MQLESEICLSPSDLIKKLIEKAEASYDVGGWFSSGEKFCAKVYYANWSDKVIKGTSFLPSWTSYFLFRILGLSPWRRLFIGVLCRIIFSSHTKPVNKSVHEVFFPLSGINGWQKIYGGSFVERQFLVPVDQQEMLENL